MKLCGHHRIESLNHYNPGTNLVQKTNMNKALISAGTSSEYSSSAIGNTPPELDSWLLKSQKKTHPKKYSLKVIFSQNK